MMEREGEPKEDATAREDDDDSKKLRDYYAKYNISLDALKEGNTSHRFIRLHPAFSWDDTLQKLKSELPPGSQYPLKVPWIDPAFGFYALPGTFKLNQSPCYEKGLVYGQDVSSGAAVAALLSDYHDCENSKQGAPSEDHNWRVLDMCCAPGIKLCAIADWLREHSSLSSNESPSVVVGVDCSESRLALCRKIIEKYQIEPFVTGTEKGEETSRESNTVRLRLYQNDGTKFGREEASNLIFDSSVATQQRVRLGKRKRRTKKTKYYERQLLKSLATVDHSDATGGESSTSADDQHKVQLFDRVLVDAECSTDGSLKHIQERLHKEDKLTAQAERSQGNRSRVLTNTQLTDDDELAELVNLQRGLAASGFRLLKKGGCMVYSTCSLSEEQNEGVVRWLLSHNPQTASIVPLSFEPQPNHRFSSVEAKKSSIQEGSLAGTIRFFPLVGQSTKSNRVAGGATAVAISCDPFPTGLYGGGFFLAKVKKSL